MNPHLFYFAIDVATIVGAALLGARVMLSYPRLRAAQLIALITLNSICDVVLGRYDHRYWIPPVFHFEVGNWAAVIMNLARNLTPGVFMLLCFTLFADKRRFPLWLLALLGAQLFLEEPAHWFIASGAPFERLLTQIVPTLLQTLFVGFALFWTVADWQDDLIETRRRTRMLTTVVIGLDVLASGLLSRLLVDQNTPAVYTTHVALVASHLAITVFVLLQVMSTDLREYLDPRHEAADPPPRPQGSTDPDLAVALQRLQALMVGEHVYRRPGLTLKALADRVGLPEYRLRKIIHEQLGYLNFNAFLHDYRIQEACGQLRDPALRRTPILTIALSVGYQSINTFNRGFRDVTGMTPSAYRSSEEAPALPVPRKIASETE